MVLSQREKYIAIALGVVLALVIVYWVVYTPLSDWSDSIQASQAKANDQADSDNRLFKKLRQLNVVWEDMKKNGLKSDVSDAQSQLGHAVTEWAAQSGVTITSSVSNTPSVVDPKIGFIQVNYQVTCTGTTSGVAKLLYQIESAKIPIRINNLRIGSKKDGADDLEVQLNLSTLCVPPAQNKPAA